MYENLMEYLQHGTVELKGMNPSQRRRLLRKAHKHSKSVPTEILMLLYCENNCGMSLCLVEEDIPRFLNAAPEDPGHFAAQLCLRCLME